MININKRKAYDVKQTSKILSGSFLLCALLTIATIIGLVIFIGVIFFQGKKNEKIKEIRDALLLLEQELSNYQSLSEKGEKGGYAPLGSDGKVPNEFIPPELFERIIYLGCWNASSNDPNIISGIGENGQLYTVCYPGNTEVDGESEWRFRDQLIFIDALSSWVRLDGGQITVNQVGNGIPIFMNNSQSNSPLIVKRVSTGMDIVASSVKDGEDESIEFSLERSVINNSQLVFQNTGSGIDIILDESPPLNTFGVKTLIPISPVKVVLDGDKNFITLDLDVSFPSDFNVDAVDTSQPSIIDNFSPLSSGPFVVAYGVPGIAWTFHFYGDNLQTTNSLSGVYGIGAFTFNNDLLSSQSTNDDLQSSCITIGVPPTTEPTGNIMVGVSLLTTRFEQSIALVRDLRPDDTIIRLLELGAHCSFVDTG